MARLCACFFTDILSFSRKYICVFPFTKEKESLKKSKNTDSNLPKYVLYLFSDFGCPQSLPASSSTSSFRNRFRLPQPRKFLVLRRSSTCDIAARSTDPARREVCHRFY
jgi:hypothetical protein